MDKWNEGETNFLETDFFFSGRKGTFTGSSGLSVAYLSGKEGDRSELGVFSRQDVSSLLLPCEGDTKFRGVDILLTSQWPKQPAKYASDVVCVMIIYL